MLKIISLAVTMLIAPASACAAPLAVVIRIYT
jgi:hypothetical protein